MSAGAQGHFSTARRTGVSNQSDDARALSVSEQETSAMFDYSGDQDGRHRYGRSESSDQHGPLRRRCYSNYCLISRKMLMKLGAEGDDSSFRRRSRSYPPPLPLSHRCMENRSAVCSSKNENVRQNCPAKCKTAIYPHTHFGIESSLTL